MAYEKALREQLGRLSADMHAIVTTAKNENNRGLTSEEVDKFHAFEADFSKIEATIAINEKSDSIAAKLAAVQSVGDISNIINDGATEQLRDEFRTTPRAQRDNSPKARAFTKYLRAGLGALSGDEREHMVFIDNNTGRPGIRNTMSTTTGSQGGYVIPQGFSDLLEEAKKWFGGIEGTVGKFITETGQPFPWPTLNDLACA